MTRGDRIVVTGLACYLLGMIACYGTAYNDRVRMCESIGTDTDNAALQVIEARKIELCTHDAALFAIGKTLFWPLMLSIKLSE